MDTKKLINWLYENGGPVIKWRTFNELMSNNAFDQNHLNSVLNEPEVKNWVHLFCEKSLQTTNYNWNKKVHGTFLDKFENYGGKLSEFGLGCGIAILDEAAERYISLIKRDYGKDDHSICYGEQMAMSLAFLGYTDDQFIQKILQDCLDKAFEFVKEDNYDIYVDVKDYSALPKAWKDVKKIINPRYTGGDSTVILPTIYNLLGFVGMVKGKTTKENIDKINKIIEYITDEKYYLNIADGYGIGISAVNGHYYSWGWSTHIPGFTGIKEVKAMNRTLLYSDIYSIFKSSKLSHFYSDLMIFLEQYKTDHGTYVFPKEFLSENKTGYWVLGMHLGLAENRRKTNTLALESTFRVLRLKKHLGLLE